MFGGLDSGLYKFKKKILPTFCLSLFPFFSEKLSELQVFNIFLCYRCKRIIGDDVEQLDGSIYMILFLFKQQKISPVEQHAYKK